MEPALAIIGALPAVAALLVLPMPAIAAPPKGVPRAPGVRGLIAAHWRVDPRVWLAFLIALYINVLSDSVDTFFPLFGLSLGIPLATSAALKGLKSGAATLIRFIFGATTVAIGAVSSLPFFFVLFLAAGVARGLLRVTSAASIAGLRAEGRDVGIASGVYNMGLDVGAIVEPAVGGFVGDLAGLGAMFQIVGRREPRDVLRGRPCHPAGPRRARDRARPARAGS